MEPASCCLSRLPLSGKFWLKRALVDAALLTGDTPPPDPDGRLLADIRVEAGRIRAVLPAGEAPCCSPGLDLGGTPVQPLTAGGRVGPGEPADLALVLPRLGPVEMRSGHIPAPIGQ